MAPLDVLHPPVMASGVNIPPRATPDSAIANIAVPKGKALKLGAKKLVPDVLANSLMAVPAGVATGSISSGVATGSKSAVPGYGTNALQEKTKVLTTPLLGGKKPDTGVNQGLSGVNQGLSGVRPVASTKPSPKEGIVPAVPRSQNAVTKVVRVGVGVLYCSLLFYDVTNPSPMTSPIPPL